MGQNRPRRQGLGCRRIQGSEVGGEQAQLVKEMMKDGEASECGILMVMSTTYSSEVTRNY